jgi:hypothetical protein
VDRAKEWKGNRSIAGAAAPGLACAAILVACGSATSRGGFDPEGASPGAEAPPAPSAPGSFDPKPAGADPKAGECEKMDLVFVVDDSGSMEEEQSNLAANFPKFVSLLDDFKTQSGAKLDWRAAVTTTGRDVTFYGETPIGTIPHTDKDQDNGAFRDKSECGGTRRWVERADADAATRFSCLANVGTYGSGYEMPLEALSLGLVDRVADGTNAGFLRPDALLAVVILTDEDDCSRTDNGFTVKMTDTCATTPGLQPLTHYVQVLDAVSHGPGRWAVAVLAGDKACTSAFGEAEQAKRLQSFVALAGANGTFGSICAGDLTAPLQKALDVFDSACRNFPPVR